MIEKKIGIEQLIRRGHVQGINEEQVPKLIIEYGQPVK